MLGGGGAGLSVLLMLRGRGIKHTRVFHNSYLTILNNKTRIYLLKKRVQSFSFAHAAKELNKKEN